MDFEWEDGVGGRMGVGWAVYVVWMSDDAMNLPVLLCDGSVVQSACVYTLKARSQSL